MYADAAFSGQPDWHGDPQKRLRVAICVGALAIGAGLSLLRLPMPLPLKPLGELVVTIVSPQPERNEPNIESPPLRRTAEVDLSRQSAATEPESETSPVPPAAVDLDRAIREAVSELPDTTGLAPVNPAFERKRSAAAQKFAPIERRVEKPIWENVEKDLTGRTILRSGDCWRVLDDPNVGNREQFEVFGQYITSCAFYKRKPRMLPWGRRD